MGHAEWGMSFLRAALGVAMVPTVAIALGRIPSAPIAGFGILVAIAVLYVLVTLPRPQASTKSRSAP